MISPPSGLAALARRAKPPVAYQITPQKAKLINAGFYVMNGIVTKPAKLVILSAAKGLTQWQARFFAALRMTQFDHGRVLKPLLA